MSLIFKSRTFPKDFLKTDSVEHRFSKWFTISAWVMLVRSCLFASFDETANHALMAVTAGWFVNVRKKQKIAAFGMREKLKARFRSSRKVMTELQHFT